MNRLRASSAFAFEPGVQFQAALLIDGEHRAAIHLQAAVEDAEDILLAAELGFKEEIELLGAAHLQGLGDHHVPGEDGEDDEEEDDALGRQRGPAPDKLQLRLGKKTKGNIHQTAHARQPLGCRCLGPNVEE